MPATLVIEQILRIASFEHDLLRNAVAQLELLVRIGPFSLSFLCRDLLSLGSNDPNAEPPRRSITWLTALSASTAREFLQDISSRSCFSVTHDLFKGCRSFALLSCNASADAEISSFTNRSSLPLRLFEFLVRKGYTSWSALAPKFRIPFGVDPTSCARRCATSLISSFDIFIRPYQQSLQQFFRSWQRPDQVKLLLLSSKR